MGSIAVLLLGSAGGMVLGALGYAWVRKRRIRPEALPADVHHVLELLRRVHRAAATCAVTPNGDSVWSKVEPGPPFQALDEAVATARLALSDHREHVLQEKNGIVALGDGRLGCAVLFASGDVEDRVVQSTLADLRRLLADFHLARRREIGSLDAPSGVPDWLTPETVEGIGGELLEAVCSLTSRPAALVMRDPITSQASVIVVSGTDRNLVGMSVDPESVVGRACVSALTAAGSGEALFGAKRQLRRQREEEGIAYSLRDGTNCVGALVVFCTIDMLSAEASRQVTELVDDAGPLLARANAVYAESLRVMTDELTGQPNRQGLDDALQAYVGGACSLLSVRIDDLDDLDPPAATAALRHVARVFRRILRDYDIAARVDGNEFALFLPDTPSDRAHDVADRIRGALAETALEWGGQQRVVTCSFGVASVPDSASNTEALPDAASTALTQAKQRGADQVLVANPLSN